MTNTKPTPGGNDVDVTFYDNYVPHLKAAEYKIKVAQTLSGPKVGTAKGEIPPDPHDAITKQFNIAGPRFVPLPPAEIHRPFPPRNASGRFEEYLPEVAFTKRALPWEREFTGNEAQPWLALLVFAKNELLVPAAQGATPRAATPADLAQNPTLFATFPLNQVAMPTPQHGEPPWPGPPAKIRGPNIKNLDLGESGAGTQCRVIDMPTATFTALLPSLDDLTLLSHVRHVNTELKVPQRTKDDGWFSAVIANRFAIGPPNATSTEHNIVHLVSLEGFEDLANQSGSPKSPSGYDYVRMVSLYSWSFTCLPEPKENFRELMLNFMAPAGTTGTGVPLQMPVPSNQGPQSGPAEQEAVNRVEAGYDALGYAMRSGETSFAWYRGPLAATVTERFLETTGPGAAENQAAPRTASEAMIYSQSTGVFDQSYATAWSTGRLLALASKPFATNLLHWRRTAHGLVDRLLEQIQSPVNVAKFKADGILDANGNLTAAGTKDLALLLDENLVSDTFKDFLAGEFAERIADGVSASGGTGPDPVVVDTVKPAAALPSDLSDLMTQPAVVSLLRQLSGLVPMGKAHKDVSGPAVTGILLDEPSVAAAEKGAKVTVTSPDGSTVAVVTTSDAVSVGSASVQIEPHDFDPTLPAGSSVALGAGEIMPSQIVAWLARTALLYGVPFNNLVPDQRMLPSESLRFFYVDRNWIDALLDGALSVGVQSSRDSLFHELMRDPLHRAVDDVLHQVREKERNAPPTGQPPAMGRMAGFLMRSAVVSGWPNLEVRAWSRANHDPATDPPMTPLRLERLSANVMIGIFPDVPVALEFNEPSEGLVFGREDEGIDLRYLPGMTIPSGKQLGNIIEIPHQGKLTLKPTDIPRRSSDANSVVTVGGTSGLAAKLAALWTEAKITLSPASFAVSMVRSPEELLFQNATGDDES